MLPRCPHCTARMIPAPDGNRLWCQFCGATRDDPDALQILEQIKASAVPSDDDPPARNPNMTGEQRRALDDAWECIQQGDRTSARYILRRALADGDFADAWYLLSLTTEDRGEKLAFLNAALAAQPYHEYAWRDKGILEGAIPNGKGRVSQKPDPAGPVAAESETQSCPLCGGALAFDAALGKLICRHCGYRPDQAAAPRPVTGGAGGYARLEHALLQRRFGFSKEWHIGARVLVCQNCHAQLTLSGTTLSTVCPFCDTAHVLVKDVVESFEEPDALLPFKVDRQAAAQAVHRRMTPEQRAEVERGDLMAVYLPFWAFAFTTTVLDHFQPASYGVRDVLVSGVNQPPERVLYELMPYDLRALIPYDHRYLAQWPAQLYSRDVIEASITGWVYIKYAAWRRGLGFPVPDSDLARTDSDDYRLPDTGWSLDFDRMKVDGLRYRLVLLPVWLATLHLAGGTHRPAMVNGQTGEAIITDSFAQSSRIIAGPNRPPIRPIPPPLNK